MFLHKDKGGNPISQVQVCLRPTHLASFKVMQFLDKRCLNQLVWITVELRLKPCTWIKSKYVSPEDVIVDSFLLVYIFSFQTTNDYTPSWIKVVRLLRIPHSDRSVFETHLYENVSFGTNQHLKWTKTASLILLILFMNSNITCCTADASWHIVEQYSIFKWIQMSSTISKGQCIYTSWKWRRFKTVTEYITTAVKVNRFRKTASFGSLTNQINEYSRHCGVVIMRCDETVQCLRGLTSYNWY